LTHRLAVALATAGLGLGACQTVTPPTVLVPVLGEEDRIGVWLERSRSEGEARKTLRAVGSLKVRARSGSGRVKQVILAERPARLRLESINFLGQTQTLLVTDGESFSFFDGRELLSGAVSRDVLLEYMGMDLEPDEAVRALLAAPRLGDGAPRNILGDGDDRIVNLDHKRVRYAADGELLSVEALDARGATRWQAAYSRWHPLPNGRYPFAMVLSFPRTELRAELKLDEVEVNSELDPALFRVRRGEGE